MYRPYESLIYRRVTNFLFSLLVGGDSNLNCEFWSNPWIWRLRLLLTFIQIQRFMKLDYVQIYLYQFRSEIPTNRRKWKQRTSRICFPLAKSIVTDCSWWWVEVSAQVTARHMLSSLHRPEHMQRLCIIFIRVRVLSIKYKGYYVIRF